MDPNTRVALQSIVEVFGLVAIAYLYARKLRPDFHDTLRLVTHIFIPCLAFNAIMESQVATSEVRDAVLAMLIQIGAGLALGWLGLLMTRKRGKRELLLPIAFVNSANLPFPLLLANFGSEGLARGVIFFITTTATVFSVGLFLLHGKSRFRDALREPVLAAVALAILLRWLHVEPPETVMLVPRLAGTAAVPLMLVLFGDSLSRVRPGATSDAVTVVVLRYVSGLAAMVVSLAILQPEGILRSVIIFYAIMPSAVVNVVLTRKAGRTADGVAGAILVTTLMTALLLPWLLPRLAIE